MTSSRRCNLLSWKAELRTVLVAAAALFIAAASADAHAYTVDQSYTPANHTGLHSIQFMGRIGQEFVPTLPALDVVELITSDFNQSNGLGATLEVQIWSATAGNPFVNLEGTSNQVSLPDMAFGEVLTHFDFPASVALTPGNLYVLEVVALPGSDNWAVATDNPGYAAGRGILLGAAELLLDVWFSEGPVPEPATLALLAAGGMVLLRRR